MYRSVNLALAFMLELVALFALCWWGFHIAGPTWLKVLAGIGAPLAAAIVWGLFAAPRARYKLATAAKLAVKALVFGASTAALIDSGWLVFGIVFATIMVGNATLIRVGNLDAGLGT